MSPYTGFLDITPQLPTLLSRLVSYYYFLRYGDDYRKGKIRSHMGDKTTFDECVAKKLRDCDPKKLWQQVNYSIIKFLWPMSFSSHFGNFVFGDEVTKILCNSLFIFHFVLPILPCKRKISYRKSRNISDKNQKRSYQIM